MPGSWMESLYTRSENGVGGIPSRTMAVVLGRRRGLDLQRLMIVDVSVRGRGNTGCMVTFELCTGLAKLCRLACG